MEYPNKKENHDFWVERIKTNSPDKVCTNDVGLDQLESNQIFNKISNNKRILEIGCGNGLLYEEIKNKFNPKRYLGTDFVQELIEICNKKRGINDDFLKLDMTEINSSTFNEKFDFIISKRAIQNVLDTQLQINTIENLGNFLDDNGFMVFVESSKNGQENINKERIKFGLEEIMPPYHNLFFDDNVITNYSFKNVRLVETIPFASDFYFITRLVYSRYAKEYLNEKPNYDHPLEKIALSMTGESYTKRFSQIKTYIFKKK